MKLFIQSLKMLLWMSLLTGIIYPVMITGMAQGIFPFKANGGILTFEDKKMGATLIAQGFQEEKFFWPRPSASHYKTLFARGSNLSPTSRLLQKKVNERRKKFLTEGNVQENIPAEFLFESGSGLDPHISIEAAHLQMDRIARARNYQNTSSLKKLIEDHKEGFFLGIFGAPYVNVLKLNMALEKQESEKET